MSFARDNEIFGDLPVRTVARVRPGAIKLDGNPVEWDGIPPAVVDPIGDYVVAQMNKGGDVRSIYLCSDGRFLYIRVDFVRRISKRIVYRINLRGLDSGNMDDRFGVVIKPPYYCTPPDTRWAYKSNSLEVALPLKDLSFDNDAFIQVSTKLMKITVDNTGWHGFEFARKPHAEKPKGS